MIAPVLLPIEAYIPKGKENAIQREALAIASRRADRPMREEIAKAQLAKVPIVNLSNGSGYYIARSSAELREYTRQERARAESRLAIVRALEMKQEEMAREEAATWESVQTSFFAEARRWRDAEQ